MVGIIEPGSNLTLETVLGASEAEIFSNAMNHDYYIEVDGINDKHFTPDEYRKRSVKMSQMLNTYTKLEADVCEVGDFMSFTEISV